MWPICQTAMISFVTRHSKTHLADYLEITLAEWKHCCILYEKSHMFKKCYNQFYTDKTGLIQCLLLWRSLQWLGGIFSLYFLHVARTCDIFPLSTFSLKLSIFLFVCFFFLSHSSMLICPKIWLANFSQHAGVPEQLSIPASHPLDVGTFCLSISRG